jgi:hypothetical protein
MGSEVLYKLVLCSFAGLGTEKTRYMYVGQGRLTLCNSTPSCLSPTYSPNISPVNTVTTTGQYPDQSLAGTSSSDRQTDRQTLLTFNHIVQE